MKKNVLIWDKNIPLKNIGGPSGYLYNINQYIEEHNIIEIDFYSHKQITTQKSLHNVEKKVNLLNRIINKLFKTWIKLYRLYFDTLTLSRDDINLIKNYDYIHIHSIHDMRKFFLLSNRNELKAKLILTSHCPEPFIDEVLYGSTVGVLFKYLPILRDFFIKKEIEAFAKADYIMFPVKEAIDVYINRSFLYKKYFECNEKKIFYTPTSIMPLSNSENEFVLDKYKIPKNHLRVCFIGRHNKVKGYDKLVELSHTIWRVNPNITFVVGGQKVTDGFPKDDRWIEMGWVNTPNLLNEVDVFILPNEQTYFDLILLEVLRAGVPVLISNTGGNKWFKDKSKGIYLYDYNNINEAQNILSLFYNLKQADSLRLLGDKNKEFYEKELNVSKYVDIYLSNIQHLSECE